MTFETVDAYIAAAPAQARAHLRLLRKTIREAAPQATESLSYMMPLYTYEGRLCYFAGYSKHVGLYPSGSAIRHFREQLAQYKWSKGAIQFRLDEPLPVALVRKIVKFRMAENRANHPFASLPRPVRQALAAAGINTRAQLAKASPKRLLSLHGLGPAALPLIAKLLGSASGD